MFRKCPAMLYQFPTGRKSQFLFVIVLTLSALSFYYFGVRQETFRRESFNFITEKNLTPSKAYPSGYVVNTPGCRIPDLHPFDKTILKYLSSVEPVQCSEKPPLIESDQIRIWVERSALPSYNISHLEDLDCCYRPFARAAIDKKHFRTDVDDLMRTTTWCQPFKDYADIFYEFVEVTCSFNNESIYKDYHAFIVPKRKRKGVPARDEERNNAQKISVLIVGVDSLSRLNYHRQMPKTNDFLQSMGAIEFFGYNKVQDNTFPNLVPLLSGHSVKEIRQFCWLNDSAFFDGCPWIWKNYSRKGYNTMFIEDSTNLGLFNYLKNGFYNSPTNYYLRPYMDANERFIGHMKPLNTKYCCGTRLTAQVLMDYAYKFVTNMTEMDKKYWAFVWESSLTHDFLNVPPNNDEIYSSFFRSIQEQNVLNKTIVIFMSDHGMRWGSIRETYQGRLEEHLPFLLLLLPPWFQENYGLAMRNLRRNTRLLTTHFDVHELIKDLLDPSRTLKDENLESRIMETRGDRGISLFLPIPVNRTCTSAGIEKTWCTCQRNKQIPISNKYVKKAAKLSVNYLNSLMFDQQQCARLYLHKVLMAHQEDEDDLLENAASGKSIDYVVLFETKPGFARFEATVRSSSSQMTVLGDISRVNAYGSQSHCVNNYRLKRYCFCL
ncbi:hypothetical protein RUM44_007054 [Polyplax serrata]|uniref:DUF229 domain containing protein n=1 Tax=Polyplax serrata TaxID=468196 RepID=A0ABR1B044_POLSC